LVSRRDLFAPALRHSIRRMKEQLRDHPTMSQHRCQQSGKITLK
jgi:hypothetical protein